MGKKRGFSVIGIIPARFTSERLPGKPLLKIGDKSMIEWVWRGAERALDNLYVATDDERIASEVERFGGSAIITSAEHRTGTDRCAEALDLIESRCGENYDVVVNIQGDEPFTEVEQILSLTGCFSDEGTDIATLIRAVSRGEDISNTSQPKVVTDSYGYALYFSRAAIPYVRDCRPKLWSSSHIFFKHVGMYAYRSNILRQITSLPPSPLEIAEGLEQNRWLENGLKIKTVQTPFGNIGVDTPEDLEEARRIAAGGG